MAFNPVPAGHPTLSSPAIMCLSSANGDVREESGYLLLSLLHCTADLNQHSRPDSDGEEG